jgi:Tfp pilus assembly protein PilO
MKRVFDKLNLRPQERRVVVVVMVLVFIVLNWMFVRPLFGQFGEAQNELAKEERTLKKYRDEIAKEKSYRALEAKLKSEGSDVLTEELQLQRIVEQHATAAGFSPGRYAPGVRLSSGRTNQFFEDQGLTIDFNTFSTNLVEFLVSMASGNSMIRVQEMNLKPDPSGTRLSGSLLFIASYQRKAPPRASTAAVAPKQSGSTPAPKATAVVKTNAAAKTTAASKSTVPPPKTTSAPAPKSAISTNKAAKK